MGKRYSDGGWIVLPMCKPGATAPPGGRPGLWRVAEHARSGARADLMMSLPVAECSNGLWPISIERGDRTPSGPGDLSNHPPALRPPPDHRIRDAVLHTGTSPRNPVGLQVSASRMPAGETVPGKRCFHALVAPIGDPIAGCPRSRGIVPAPVGNDEGGPAWGAPAHPVERADRFGGRGTREETVLLLRLVGARSWEMQ